MRDKLPVVVAVILAVALLLFAVAGPCFAEERSLRPLFDALWAVEASSQLAPPDGDDGRSIGPYQVSKAYWLDARMPDGTWQDCRKKPYAERVMRRYWKRYGAETDEQRARMHNGGPRGHKKRSTLAYWEKVQAYVKGASNVTKRR